MKTTILALTLAGAAPMAAQYCMLTGQTPYSTLQPGITSFKLHTINRTSSNSESSSAVVVTTGQSATLNAGQTYTISISHSEDTQFFPGARNNLRVWIDYNNNFSYLDAGETVLSVDLQTPATTYSATFTVPSSAPAGTVMLRATAKMSSDAGHSLPTPCNNPADPLGYHGEMEDYLIDIQPSAQAPSASFAISTSTVCKQGTIIATNSSSGTPAPTFSWSSTPPGGVSFLPSSTAQNPSIKFTNQGAYTITCIATNSAGSGSAMKTVTVQACSISGFEELFDEEVVVYPLPAADVLNIAIGETKSGTIRLYDINGNLVGEHALHETSIASIDVRQLSGGCYRLCVITGNGIISKTVLIAK
jgi:hypothetical protein